MKLGTKTECHSCGAKFYDFDKPDPACPKCGVHQESEEPSEALKPAAKKAKKKAKPAKKKATPAKKKSKPAKKKAKPAGKGSDEEE